MKETTKRVIMRVAQNESRCKFSAFNPNDAGAGVSFGLIQFNQKKGTLGILLKSMFKKDPELFATCWGISWVSEPGIHAALVDKDITAFKNLDLSGKKDVFTALGHVQAFQEEQLLLAENAYYKPAKLMSLQFGAPTERNVACIMDSCVQNGVGGTQRYVKAAKCNIYEFAELADANKYADGRRNKILHDTNLSSLPMASEDTETFEPEEVFGVMSVTPKVFQAVHGLTADGVIGPNTEAMLALHNVRISKLTHIKDLWNTIHTAQNERQAKILQATDNTVKLVHMTYTMAYEQLLGVLTDVDDQYQ